MPFAIINLFSAGIRKILGASVPVIVRLLSRDFLKLIFFSILISTPISWWIMHRWLQGYVYRVDMQ